MKRSVQAVVPGSTSNLGPGFDLFGLAVDLYLRVTVSIEGSFSMVGTAETEWVVDREGEGSGPPAQVPLDDSNLVVRGLTRVWEAAGLALDGKAVITGRSDIPVARGLGASGAAIVAGLLTGSHLCEAAIGDDELIGLATAEEGHPDNVAPSLRGGLVASAVMDDGEVFLGRSVTQHKNVSDLTAHAIDEEIRKIIDRNYQRAKTILEDNEKKLRAMAKALMKYETIDADQIDDIMMGKEPGAPANWDDDDADHPQKMADPKTHKEKDAPTDEPPAKPA